MGVGGSCPSAPSADPNLPLDFLVLLQDDDVMLCVEDKWRYDVLARYGDVLKQCKKTRV